MEQARAISNFGGSGSLGNSEKSTALIARLISDHFIVLGLFIGALFVEYASWHWTFWFLALMTVPIASSCMFLVPRAQESSEDPKIKGLAKFKSLDIVGVSLLTGKFQAIKFNVHC